MCVEYVWPEKIQAMKQATLALNFEPEEDPQTRVPGADGANRAVQSAGRAHCPLLSRWPATFFFADDAAHSLKSRFFPNYFPT